MSNVEVKHRFLGDCIDECGEGTQPPSLTSVGHLLRMRLGRMAHKDPIYN